jgi:hypothetical protein
MDSGRVAARVSNCRSPRGHATSGNSTVAVFSLLLFLCIRQEAGAERAYDVGCIPPAGTLTPVLCRCA